MSAKHTSGPWHIGGISNPNTDPRYSIWGPTPEGAQSGEWIAKGVTPANARLIAAAPELLEAAKEIVELAYLGGRGGIVEFRPHEFDDLKAAIARAEGGQS